MVWDRTMYERLFMPGKVCPDADFSRELGGCRIDRESWQKGNANASASGHTMNTTTSPYGTNTPIEDLIPSDDEDIITLRLSESLKSMSLAPRRHARFFGKSSGVMLIQKAIDLKKEVTGFEETPEHFIRPLEDDSYPVSLNDPQHNAYILIPP